MKVLVVDGSKQDRRRVVEAMLDLTNVIVYGAVADLHGALAAIEHEVPDVIICDAQLPDGPGAELIAAARRHTPAPSVAVFTSIDSDESRQRCRDAGADLYIHKDAGLLELQDGVRELASARRRDRHGDPFRLLGRMTAGIAHDLNNYLAVLSVSLDMIERRDSDPQVYMQARNALDAASAMTRNLIAYARGGSPVPQTIDVGAVVRRTTGLVAAVVPLGVLISLDVDDDVPAVRGVASELEQVVLNLVLNACDAMPRGGQVSVAVRTCGAKVVLEVTDTGGGLPEGVQLAAGTLSPSSKRPGGGLGLGIVRSVVERHHAELAIARRTGGGTVVTVTLQAAA